MLGFGKVDRRVPATAVWRANLKTVKCRRRDAPAHLRRRDHHRLCFLNTEISLEDTPSPILASSFWNLKGAAPSFSKSHEIQVRSYPPPGSTFGGFERFETDPHSEHPMVNIRKTGAMDFPSNDFRGLAGNGSGHLRLRTQHVERNTPDG